jgi:spore maturation protein B
MFKYLFVFFVIISALFTWTIFAQDQTQTQPPKPPFNPFTSIMDLFSQWCIPLIIFGIAFYAYAIKRVKVYEVFVEGAKEGFNVAIRIIPYLIAILFTIGMFRAGGAEKIFIRLAQPITIFFGIPPSILPLCFIRPLSGAGARAIMIDIFKNYGPDSLDGLIASCVQGSTETTFYVIAVYLGSISVRKTRYAVPACLFGDLCGMIASVIICKIWPWPF